MNWRLFIAWRYFRTRRKERFISIISLISILGVAVGVAALIIVLAVMSGFDRELRTRIIGTTSHVFIEREGGVAHPDPAIEKALSENKDVVGFSPFVTGQVIIKRGDSFTGAVLNGIDEETEKNVANIKQYIKEKAPELGEKGLFIGSELAGELRLRVGDDVSLISAASIEPSGFKIAGIFHTGLYSFDANNMFISLGSAQKIFDIDGLATGVAVKIADELEADRVKLELKRSLGFPYFARSWMDLNKNLFSALKLEKITMFIILTLIVIVACFNIASTLIVRVVEKTKDIGILKAIGAGRGDIKAIFKLEGFFVGMIGTLLGVGLGLTISWVQKVHKVVRLPRDIYYIDALPVYINWHDPLIIAVSAVLLSLIATLYPSRQAARLEVVEALRYE